MVAFVTLVAVDASNTPNGGPAPLGGLASREFSEDGATTDSLAPEGQRAGDDVGAVADEDTPPGMPAEVQAIDEGEREGSGSPDSLLVAEVATAGLALAAGGGALLYWRRRT
jgi:hypothetical protein